MVKNNKMFSNVFRKNYSSVYNIVKKKKNHMFSQTTIIIAFTY